MISLTAREERANIPTAIEKGSVMMPFPVPFLLEGFSSTITRTESKREKLDKRGRETRVGQKANFVKDKIL